MGSDIDEESASILLNRAKKLAVNHYWWGINDIPTDEEIERFCKRYEYEIYDVAKALQSDADHDGEISHTELGITRVWSKGNSSSSVVTEALGAIPAKTYFWAKA